MTSAGEIRWNTGFGSSGTREKESRLPLLVTASVRVCGTGKYPASDNERKVFAPKEDSLPEGASCSPCQLGECPVNAREQQQEEWTC